MKAEYQLSESAFGTGTRSLQMLSILWPHMDHTGLILE